MKENKKIVVYILIGLFIIILGFSFVVGSDKNTSSNNDTYSNNPNQIIANAQKESENVKDSEKKELTEINVDTYLEYYKSSDSKLILVARPTCQYCQIAEPIIQNIAYEKNIEINYLNTDNFKDDDESRFVKSDEYFNEGFGTPLLLVVKDNKIIDKVDGLTDKAHYIEFFQKHGFIK